MMGIRPAAAARAKTPGSAKARPKIPGNAERGAVRKAKRSAPAKRAGQRFHRARKRMSPSESPNATQTIEDPKV